MIEIAEAIVLADQINQILSGKRIDSIVVNHTPHKFAWYFEDCNDYEPKLKGKIIERADAYGGLIEIILGDIILLLGDGVNLRYFHKEERLPEKHQLLVGFDDGSVLIASIQMYGGIWCFREGEFDNIYYKLAKEKPSPLSEEFDFNYYDMIISDESLRKKSLKFVLATEQRIPGLGNGVLQDILFNAKLHPKRKMETLSGTEKDMLYNSIKSTLKEMTLKGGRDTEKNLLGDMGGYVTKLSKNTVKGLCGVCGKSIVKESYMGGSIYYCEGCQQL